MNHVDVCKKCERYDGTKDGGVWCRQEDPIDIGVGIGYDLVYRDDWDKPKNCPFELEHLMARTPWYIRLWRFVCDAF